MPRPRILVCTLIAALACGESGEVGTTQRTGFDPPEPHDPTITEPIMTSTTGVATTTGTDTAGTSTTVDPFPTDTAAPDLGTTKGCRGKIDFLLSINRSDLVEPFYPNVLAALADFRVFFEERFADFDLHVMVVVGDPFVWGIDGCEEQCANNGGAGCAPLGPDDFPCEAYGGLLTSCDFTFGAGSTFPAAFEASNERCPVADGRRYITGDDDLGEAFSCISRQGIIDFGELTALAMVHALDPEILAPGGCNAGFVRDDALLVVTLISRPVGEDTPSEKWMPALYAAKGGDPDAFILLGILGDHGHPNALCGLEGDGDTVYPLQKFVNEAPHGMWTSLCADDHTPFFDEAAALIDEVCEDFVPV